MERKEYGKNLLTHEGAEKSGSFCGYEFLDLGFNDSPKMMKEISEVPFPTSQY